MLPGGNDLRLYGVPAYEADLYRTGRYPVPVAVPCDSRVPWIHYPWFWQRYVHLAIVATWCAVTVSFFVLKVLMAEVDDHDDRNYFTYLTNWGWTFESFYASMKLLALLESGIREKRAMNGWAPGNDFLMRVVYEVLFLPRLALNAGITFGVLVVLWDSPGLVVNYIQLYGGNVVLSVNTLVHVFPLGMAIVDVLLNALDLRHLYTRTFRGLATLLVLNFITPMLILFLYASHSSPGDVYNLTAWYVTVAVIAVFLLAMISVMSLVVFMHSPYAHVRPFWTPPAVKEVGEPSRV